MLNLCHQYLILTSQLIIVTKDILQGWTGVDIKWNLTVGNSKVLN